MPAALLSAIALLAACGGGGDNATPTPAPQTPPSENSPAPAPGPKPDPAPQPEPTGELRPSLSAPQPGSTAAVGNDSEGLWVGVMNATLVDNSGKFVHARLTGVLGGAFQFSGSTWTLGPGTLYETGFAYPATGAGTITPGQRFDGNFVATPGNPTNVLSGTYDPSSALAVDHGCHRRQLEARRLCHADR